MRSYGPILPTLTQTSVNVRLNEPGSLYNDRVNQLDVTLSKSFRGHGGSSCGLNWPSSTR